MSACHTRLHLLFCHSAEISCKTGGDTLAILWHNARRITFFILLEYPYSVIKSRASSVLSTNNITMQFGSKPLFENISVKFGGGNRYGLIGANGCGKSTFMKILGAIWSLAAVTSSLTRMSVWVNFVRINSPLKTIQCWIPLLWDTANCGK